MTPNPEMPQNSGNRLPPSRGGESSAQQGWILRPLYGCWIWQGRKDRDGYGVIWRNGRAYRAHQELWEEAFGPVPKQRELDHLCRVRACCRPSHMELVTRKQNVRERRWSRRAQRIACPAGHQLVLHALRTEYGGFICRECNKGPR